VIYILKKNDSSPHNRPIEYCMGLIVCYIETARGESEVVWIE